jgi:alpha-beta hydrolase superfamily lysophospholipase
MPDSGPAAGPTTGWFRGEGGLQLGWLQWDAAGPRGSVLLVHGFGDHAGRYADVPRVLGARGLAVAAYDQRGHGRSPGRRGDAPGFESFLADLDAAWAHAERALPKPLVLYGHSFGGLVAMRWIQTRSSRPRAVVLSAPWLATKMAVPRWKLAAARVLLRLAPGLPIDSGADRPDFLTRDPERAAAYRADRLVHHVVSARFHAAVANAQAQALEAQWPEVPTLLMLPGDDRLVDADAAGAWAKRHPGITVLVRDEGRHELHNDLDRARALGAVSDWLAERLPAEPAAARRVSPGP